MLETIQHKCPKIETPCRKLASKRVPQISDRHKLKNTYFHLVNHDKGGDRDKERHEIVPAYMPIQMATYASAEIVK